MTVSSNENDKRVFIICFQIQRDICLKCPAKYFFSEVKVKSGLYISRESRKHVLLTFNVCLVLHIVVMISGIHISQEILAINMLTALKPQGCSVILRHPQSIRERL